MPRTLPRTSFTWLRAKSPDIAMTALLSDATAKSSPSATKGSILSVEDDASLAEVLAYNLRQEGYDSRVARDGQQGLREIRLSAPDLVILDLMLPMIEGLEMCRLLRADPATQDVA